MFGLFRGKIELRSVVNDIADALESAHEQVDDLLTTELIATEDNHHHESAALAYILGWLAIQSSSFGTLDKQRLSSELTGEWSRRMSDGVDSGEYVRFLQNRITLYRQAMDHGDGRDWVARLLIRFLGKFGMNTPEHAESLATLYTTFPLHLQSLSNFLNEVNRQFKLT